MPEKPYVVGHRGAAKVEPENTLRGFRYAIELGVDAVECDVHLTRDGRLIVMHDNAVDRTTNGTGNIADMSFDEIRALDAGKGEQVSTLAEVLDVIRGKVDILIELKGEGVERQAAAAVQEAGVAGQVTFTSFVLDRIREIKRIDDSLAVGAIFSRPSDDFLAEAKDAGAKSMGMNIKSLTTDLVDQIHVAGFQVRGWNPDTVEEMKAALATGVDGLGSNRPDLLMELVRG